MTLRGATFQQPEFSKQVREARYFSLHHLAVVDRRLVVICGGREACAPDYLIERATFPDFVIEWVEKGRGEVCAGGKRMPLRPGSVYCYGPGISYGMSADASQPMTKGFLQVAGSEVGVLLRQAGCPPGRCLQVTGAAELSEIFEGMYREGTHPGPETRAIVAAYFRLFLLKVRARRVGSREADTARLETFLRCREFLRGQFLRHSSLAAAAEALGLTPTYLCRLFREHGEITPYQFLIRLRMNYALDRLLLSGGCVKQACYESGFSDPAHFSRLFKQVHGLPPRELASRMLRHSGAGASANPGPRG